MRDFLSKNLGLESLQFQTDAFFKELTLSVNALRELKKDEIADSPQVGVLNKVVNHHTGLNIAFEMGAMDPCVDIPMVNKNNPLINSFIRDYINSANGLKMISEAKSAVRGTVNLKTGKVSGVFSEVLSTIHMPTDMFVGKKFTSEEIAAIMLHEIGHLFVYYEFMARSVTTNQVLAGLSKALDGSADVSEREMVLMTVKKAMNLTELDVQELARSKNSKVTEIVVISNIAHEIESEIGSNVCDFSTWEYLSDEFAARQGAGAALQTALVKLYKSVYNISFRSSTGYLSIEALKLFLIYATFVGVPFTAMAAVFLIAMDGTGDGSYDRPGARMVRIRNQIIEAMKDKKLDKETHARLAESLQTADEVLAQVNDRRQLLGVLWDALLPSARRARKQLKLQQELESIAMNDLFAKSADLRQLA